MCIITLKYITYCYKPEVNGRIWRFLVKDVILSDKVSIVAINEPFMELYIYMVYQFKYDIVNNGKKALIDTKEDYIIYKFSRERS